MSEELPIGPNRCHTCGGEYGEYAKYCPEWQNSNTPKASNVTGEIYARLNTLRSERESMENSVVEACAILPNVSGYIAQLEKQRDALQRENTAMRDALKKCVTDISFWSDILDKEWANFDGQLNPALNLANHALAATQKELA